MRGRLTLTVAVAVGLSAGTALAATDGTLGLSSTGTVDISVTLGNVVQISGLADFVVPLWTVGDGDVQLTQNICVFANNAGGDYLVTTTSANAAGPQWRLFDGGANYVNYDIGWVDASGGTFAGSTAGPAFASGVTSNNQDFADQVDPLCAGGPTATLAIQMLEAGNLDAATDGVYTDVLTVLIQPN